MITKEDFLNVGYVEYPVPSYEKYVTNCLAKTIYGPNDIRLYFIHVKLWKWPDGDRSASCEGHFYLPSDVAFQVNLSCNEKTTTDFIEYFYAKVFNGMECIADPHNN